ncbi:MAG: hypothetical protein JW839_03870 [Candidatus Lokiarchaeota archaeon]|nr:hypothetical protein [Candidatus Lokiarchaeota archaeon]
MIHQSWLIERVSMFLILLLIWAVFLLYRLFKRKERLDSLVYVVATIPYAYLWWNGFDYLGSIFVLLMLWTVSLVRDLVMNYAGKGKDKHKESDFANTILLCAIGVGVLFLMAAILPAFNPLIVYESLGGPVKAGVQNFGGIVWLPVLDPVTNPAIYTNPFLRPFQLMLTVDILAMIVPMLYEIKVTQARIPVWPVIFLAIIFALPTIYLLYIWILIPDLLLVIGLFIGVLYFIVLLGFTKGKGK